jgi:hypothetical protein
MVRVNVSDPFGARNVRYLTFSYGCLVFTSLSLVVVGSRKVSCILRILRDHRPPRTLSKIIFKWRCKNLSFDMQELILSVNSYVQNVEYPSSPPTHQWEGKHQPTGSPLQAWRNSGPIRKCRFVPGVWNGLERNVLIVPKRANPCRFSISCKDFY